MFDVKFIIEERASDIPGGGAVGWLDAKDIYHTYGFLKSIHPAVQIRATLNEEDMTYLLLKFGDIIYDWSQEIHYDIAWDEDDN